MNSTTEGSSKILAAMAESTHHDYDQLPESIKLLHSPEQYKWLGSERLRIIERETQPDSEVIE